MKLTKFLSFSHLIFIFACLAFSIVSFFFLRNNYFPKSDNLKIFDIRAFYTGGLMVSKHVTANFYSPQTQYYWQKNVFALPNQRYLMPFVYPSFVAVPFSLLSQFPVVVVYQITALINTLLAITSFYMLLSALRIFSSRILTALSCLLFFTYLPLWEGLAQGQLSFILFFSIVMSWFALKKQKLILGGIFLALLLVRPNLLILPFLLLLWKKEFRTLFGIGLGAIMLLYVSVLTTGFNSLSQYISLLAHYQSIGGIYVHPQFEPTIRGFFQAAYQSDSLKNVLPMYTLLSTALVSILLYAWRGKLNMKGKKFDLQWSLLIFITLLTSLHTNTHDLLLLAFPLLIFFSSSIKPLLIAQKAPWKISLIYSLLLFFLILGGSLSFFPLLIVPPIFVITLLFVWKSITLQEAQETFTKNT